MCMCGILFVCLAFCLHVAFRGFSVLSVFDILLCLEFCLCAWHIVCVFGVWRFICVCMAFCLRVWRNVCLCMAFCLCLFGVYCACVAFCV